MTDEDYQMVIRPLSPYSDERMYPLEVMERACARQEEGISPANYACNLGRKIVTDGLAALRADPDACARSVEAMRAKLSRFLDLQGKDAMTMAEYEGLLDLALGVPLKVWQKRHSRAPWAQKHSPEPELAAAA